MITVTLYSDDLNSHCRREFRDEARWTDMLDYCIDAFRLMGYSITNATKTETLEAAEEALADFENLGS